MSAFELFRVPQGTIPKLMAADPRPWVMPAIAYFCLSFAEGHENLVERYPEWNALLLIGVSALGSIVIGAWLCAAIYGGLMYLGALLFGGKRGAAMSIRAVGYGLFWPGVVGASAAAAATILDKLVGQPSFAMLALVIQVCAGLWGVYTAIAALRAWHSLSWPRAIGAYFVPLLALILVTFLVVMILMISGVFPNF